MGEHLPVLIAGAGIGGLTAALALRRRRIPVHVVERAPRLEEFGAGLQISPNAGRVIKALGLSDALDRVSVRPAALRFIDGRSGRPLADLPLGPAAEKRWGAPYRVVHRADLQRVLLEACEAHDVPITLDTEFVECAETPERVIAQTRTGGQDETLPARLLVGADGLRSAVRAAVGMGDPPVFSGQIAWRAILPIRARPETGVWLGPGAHLVSYPLDGERLNLVAVTRGQAGADGWSQKRDPAELATAFRNWSPTVQKLIKAAPEWRAWPLYDRAPDGIAPTGRITLLGDAAHPMLPHLAQGAAMAIEDAAALVHALTETANDVDALRRYERTRRPRTARAQKEARRNGTINQLSGPAALARNFALSRAGPERLAARFDWLYGA